LPQGDVQDFIFSLDAAGRISGLASNLPETVRIALSAKFGRPLPEACSLRDRQRIDSVLKAVLSGGDVQPTAVEFLGPRGGQVECRLKFEVLGGTEKRVESVLVFGTIGQVPEGVLARLPGSILSRLMDMAKSLNLVSDLDPVVDTVVNGAKILTKADCSVVFLKDRMTGLLRVAGHNGLPDTLLPLAVHEDEGIIGRVLAGGKPVREGRPPKELPNEDPAAAMGKNSFIHVPLTHEARTIGVLSVFAKSPDAFDEAAEAVLSGLADISAAAILRAQVRRDLSRLEASTRMILDEAPLGIISIDAEGGITQANPECVNLNLFPEIGTQGLPGRNLFSCPIILNLPPALRGNVVLPYPGTAPAKRERANRRGGPYFPGRQVPA